MRFTMSAVLVGVTLFAGCGTTRWSDTKRTATEQLLISDAMDRAVSQLDFRAVAGKRAFLDSSYIKTTLDADYLISSLRQHMLASGCIVTDKRDEADYVVEVRTGVVGTDRRELLFGVPATNVPQGIPLPGVPSSIPELPLAKKTEQRAVAKIAVFAYNRRTGRPVWQSGVMPIESTAKDIWVLGAGPFQRGSIYNGTSFAGDKIRIPLLQPRKKKEQAKPGEISIAKQAFFAEPKELLAERAEPPKPASHAKPLTGEPDEPPSRSQGVIHASHAAPDEPPKELNPNKQP